MACISYPFLIVAAAVLLGVGILGGAWFQYGADYPKLHAEQEFDAGKRFCANFPLDWDCLSTAQQQAAKQYAKEHTH